jgi:hypothetical protein
MIRMPPDSDGDKRTVGCAHSELIILEHHLIKMKNENPIRMMTDEEVLFHQATLCTQCD